jgi:hypothetical protein
MTPRSRIGAPIGLRYSGSAGAGAWDGGQRWPATTVMNSVDQGRAGVASGINNAVSRIAALLAVTVCEALLKRSFQSDLNRH